MSGLIGKKIGMTSLFDANGSMVACTVIEAEPNVVSHVKTVEKDGYKAVQLSAMVSVARRTRLQRPWATSRRRARHQSAKSHEFKEFGEELKLG
jgi:large subunit ribosomal protein L3